jgi:protein-S-isoprenylcysteine O-methyltransferase Ste14
MKPHFLSALYAGFGIGTLVVLGPALIRMLDIDPVRVALPGATAAGIALVALGALAYFVCVFDFAGRGRGTPAFWDPPRALIINPCFRVVRNPMYVGVALMIAGQALWWGSPLTLVWAALVTTAFHVFVVAYEEPHLRRTFGDHYSAYCERVPRWVPRVPIRRLTTAAIHSTLRS